MKKKICIIGLALSALVFAACGGAADKSASNAGYTALSEEAYDYDGGYAPSTFENNSEFTEAEQLNDTARKLIKTYNMSVETEVFDELMLNLEQEINVLGGYIQNLDTYNGSSYSYGRDKSASLTVRIPVKKLDSFVNFVGNAAHVTNKNLSVEDVTMTYVDIESRRATYEIEQERLLALLENAKTMEEIITLESRLSEVRYQLESMASQLRAYDNLVDYATVNINVSEVVKFTEPTPISYGERLTRSFTDSVENVWEGLKNFLVWFVGAIPGLVIFAIIVTIIVVIIKAIIKANNKRNLAKEEKRRNMAMQAAQTAAQKAEENKIQ